MWWSVGNVVRYDAHQAPTGPLSCWAAYRVFWYSVQCNRPNFDSVVRSQLSASSRPLALEKTQRMSSQEVKVGRVHVLLPVVLQAFLSTVCLITHKHPHELVLSC
jgi:hypothetical protein